MMEVEDLRRRVAELEEGLRDVLAIAASVRWRTERLTRFSSEQGADRCDRIVNNGMGEPTECGRTLPCEIHDAVAPSEPIYDNDGIPIPDSTWEPLRDPAALPAEVGE